MNRLLTSALLAVTVATFSASLAAQKSSDLDTANKLFKAGNFSSADKIYRNVVSKNHNEEEAIRQLGYIALLGNQLDPAQKWLEKAIALKPDDASARVMLATVYYRRDDLPKAGEILQQLGPNDQAAAGDFKMLTVPKLESFRGLKAYELRSPGQSTTLKFATYKLLPVVTVRVNGAPDATFFIDTGGAELVLDTDYAKELGVKSMGSFQGTFSGGQNAEVLTSKVDSVKLGDWTISNVPVVMMALRSLSEAFGVKRLDGCIGTNVLYHFLATMDYPHQQLVLRRKDADSLKQLNQAAGSDLVRVPMYLAGDHYIVSLGQVNNAPPAMLFVDTGLAGAGVKLGGTMLKSADIKLQEDKAQSGAGGGGTLKIVPYTVSRVSLGEIKEQNVEGLYDGPFPWENSFGFYLAGMVGDYFVKPYAVTYDFSHMQMLFQK